jgi:protein-L-isoaspartate(D-aspartate) O-methyltransferase
MPPISAGPNDSELPSIREAYADLVAATARVRTPGLRDALAVVPRERFLRPPPWLVVGQGEGRNPSLAASSSDPRAIYANVSVAIDADRQLFNGAPASVVPLIDALRLRPGGRVLHVGTGLGYYSAIIARVVGPTGTVVAVEVDETLLTDARSNLGEMPWVQVRATEVDAAPTFDAILVNAGVTHPQVRWLDALELGGRLIVPLTVAMPGPASSLGKGIVVAIERTTEERFTAEMLSLIAIYSAVGLRGAAIESALSQALRRIAFPNLAQLRRDPHDRNDACWLHGDGFCLSMEPA